MSYISRHVSGTKCITGRSSPVERCVCIPGNARPEHGEVCIYPIKVIDFQLIK